MAEVLHIIQQTRIELLSVNNSHEQSRQVFYSLYKLQNTHGLLSVLRNNRFLLHQNSQVMQKQTCNCRAQNRHDASALLKC